MNIKIIIFLFISVTLCFSQGVWTTQVSGTNTVLFDVHFANELEGWVAGNTGLILHTSDGGANWEQQTAPANNTYYSVFFLDEQHGWAGGFAGKLIRTIDGGTTWIDGSAGTNRFRYDIQFVTADSGWVVGGDHGTYPTFRPNREIYFSADGGVSWTAQYTASNENPLRAVHFIDRFTGFAVGESGAVMQTSDGGNNWAETTTLSSYELSDVFFINASTGWIVGYYLGLPHTPSIFSTTDGGQTWNQQSFAENEKLQRIHFTDELHGWAVGGTAAQSLIMHTSDGGQSWQYQNSPTSAALFNLNFVDRNSGWAVGMDGTIIHFADNVTALNELSGETSGILAGFDLLDNYPNPFNPTTTIPYANPKTQGVRLQIYNVLGQEVKTLVNATQGAGSYSVTWDGTDNFNRPVSSGVYLYQLRAGNQVKTKRLMLLE